MEAAARAKLADLEVKIRDLERLRGVLARLVRCCRKRQPTGECPILAMLEERE